MLQNDTLEYVVARHREIHEYPEIGFDLPKTLPALCLQDPRSDARLRT